MPRGRPRKALESSEEERETLERWTRRRTGTQQIAVRSRIVLRCGEGLSNREVAEPLEVSELTVGKWLERFRLRRLEGLVDEPRPGAPRSITDEEVEEVITKTLESTRRRTPLTGPRGQWPRIWACRRPRSLGSGVLSAVQPHLAKDLQVYHRSLLRRKGARRRLVFTSIFPSEPWFCASTSNCSSPSLGSVPTHAPDAAGLAAAAHARLHPARYDFALRSPRHQDRRDHRLLSSPSSSPGVLELPQAD